MIERVTQAGMQRSSLLQLQNNLSQMAKLQEQLNSGKVIGKPSDDPAGTVDAMRVRADQRATAQYLRNAKDGESWLTTVDSALQTVSSLLRRARDLTVQGASSGSLSDTARTAIATELQSISSSLLEQANTTYLGRSVFAGTSSAGRAFTDDHTFTGTDTPVERRISENTKVQVDSSGKNVFGEGAASVFALLTAIAGDITAGTEVAGRLGEIDAHIDNVLTEVGRVGARTNEILRAQESLAGHEVTLAGQLASVEDADLAETIVNLQMQEVGYQAALGATARVLQPSLLDFLR